MAFNGEVDHDVLPRRTAHLQFVGINGFPQTQQVVRDAFQHQPGFLSQLSGSRFEKSLARFDVASGRDPDAGESPHVAGSPRDEDVVVGAGEQYRHPDVDSPVLDFGGQVFKLGFVEMQHRAQGGVFDDDYFVRQTGTALLQPE